MMIRITTPVIILVVSALNYCCYASAVVPKDEGDKLLIGWASTDITPDGPVSIGGGAQARVFDNANDPVTATALVLESVRGNSSRDLAIMISVDLLRVSDQLKKAVEEKVEQALQVDISKIVMNATHTHSAPVTRIVPERTEMLKGYDIDLPVEWSLYGIDLEVMSPVAYVNFAAERIAAAVEKAWEKRAPGGISFGVAHAFVGQNRLTSYFDGSSKMYGKTDDFEFSHSEGYEDHSINLLYTWDEDSKLTGVLVNVAVPAQAGGAQGKISADYWHETRMELRRRLGKELFVFPQLSAAGDQSPVILIDRRAQARMHKLTGRSQREQIAVNIADAVTAILPAMKNNINRDPVFTHKVENIELSRRHISGDDLYTAKRTWHRPEVETVPETFERLMNEYKTAYKKFEEQPELKKEANWYVPITKAYWRLMRASAVLDRYKKERTGPTESVEVHAIRIDDMVIATNPFELYIDFGMQMKARSKAIQTFVVQLAGYGTYVPTHRAVAGGAYGAIPQSNIIGPEGGRQLVNQTLALIDSIWEETELK